MSNLSRSKVTDGLHFSANIVKKISEFRLSKGNKLSDEFIIQGVPFWTAAQPDLALHVFPPILFKYKNNQLLLKYRMKSIKYKLKEFRKIFSTHNISSSRFLGKDVWLLLSSTGYIYRDTLQPIEDEILSSCPDIQAENYASIWEKNTLNSSLSETILVFRTFKRFQSELRHKREQFFKNDFDRLCMALPEVSSENLRLAFYWFFSVFAQRNIINAIRALQCFKQLNPAKIISGDVADPLNRIYTGVAQKNGIAVVDVQFGVYDDSSVEWMFCNANKVALWGKYFSTLFEKVHSVDSSRLVVTGSPRFDYLLKENLINIKGTTVERNKITKLLFASMYTAISDYDANYDVNSIDTFKKMVIDVVEDIEEIQMLIKPHPLEDIKWTIDCRSENITVLDKESDIRNYITSSDIFLTFGSTATFDALLSENVVLSADTPGLVWWDDLFLKHKASIPIRSKEELNKVLRDYIYNRSKVINESKVRSLHFINDKLFTDTQKASIRIIDLVRKL